MTRYVYAFEEGKKEMKELLGGKGANLAEMTNLGIPVPPGFTITTEACDQYNKLGLKYPEDMWKQVEEKLAELEKKMSAKLGDPENPLLVSVRSGAAVSMPGMMDTVLNLGLNDKSVEGLAKKTGNERFAYDAYRRFINMFGDVVMGVEHKHFEEVLDKAKETKGVEFDTDLEAEDLKKVCQGYKEVVQRHTGKMFPNDPKEQLKLSINAVFDSWGCKRAIAYRKINNISGLIGTAVNVQTMVFGNMGDTSGTGVFFTRNPSTGANEFYGEYLINAQGEDVVAGIRTPEPITKLKEVMPENYDELVKIYKKVENHYKDMQDMEFTIQENKLYILQTRAGKRTAHAAVKLAIDMVAEGLIDKKTAILRVPPEQLDQLLHKQLDPIAKGKADVIGKGLPASPGGAVGKIAFTADRAVEMAEKGDKVILVRVETSPEDIQGMHAAQGILTARGGMTSHAAVVARGMGTCCVAGCADVSISEQKCEMKAKGQVFKEGDYITLDGTAGEVYKGQIPTIDPELKGEFGTLMEWADEFRRLKIKTNAETEQDIKVALRFGAEGIGLA
ncbi:MAG: pyruvate, phosphate dikinase, partial [Nanoarchaeota archaeon]